MKTKAIPNITELRAVELLNRTYLFKHLSAEEKRTLASLRGLFRFAQAGLQFIEQGSFSQTLYIVMSGEALVYQDAQPVGKVVAGEFVGEVSFILNEPRTATVEALTDLILLRINTETFQRLPVRVREIVKDKIIAGLHQRVKRLNTELLQLRALFPQVEPVELEQSEESLDVQDAQLITQPSLRSSTSSNDV